jgi:putative peptide maturation system protein
MASTLDNALNDTLDTLMQWWRESVGPEEATAHFRALRERYQDLDMDLVWEEEPYSRTVHYDALLHLPEQGTVSLSFCPDRAVPWILRHAHSASEYEVVRVNGQTLKVDQAMACLDFLWNEGRVIAGLVDTCLMREAAQKRAIEVSDAELQQTMDAFRHRRGLHTAEATDRWLEQHGMTHETLERHLLGETVAAKLRDQIADGRVEEYFDQHSAVLDAAHIARIKVADEESAWRLGDQFRSGKLDFFEAAQQQFFSAPNPAAARLFAVVRRGQLSEEQSSAIFSSSAGQIVGPLRSGDGYELVRVLQIVPALLDESTREAVKDRLFEQWLEEQRQQATVEWFWGNTSAATTL